MEQPLNILWQKGVSSDVYIDIFDIRNNEFPLSAAKILVDGLYKGAKSSGLQKSDLNAKLVREQANAIFAQGKYYDAMEQYNLAMSMAKNCRSEEFGLAIGNRASCFFNLNMIENCLADVQLAKGTNYPKHLMHKLNEREIRCTKLMAKPQFKSASHDIWEPTLSFNEHNEFAGVADCLKIKKNDRFGRHIVTTCDLKIGQTILVERPYAAVPPRENEGRMRCWYCFKECMNFIPCKSCLCVIYCNEECMEMSFHKMECNRPAALSRKETYELIMRMIFKINADFTDVDALMDLVQLLIDGKKPPMNLTQSQKYFCALFQLVHHHKKVSAYGLERMRASAGIVILTTSRYPEFKRKYLSLKHKRFLQHLILHLFHVAEHAIDMFEYFQKDTTAIIANYEYRHFARGMYPFACYINHSCVPNICWFHVDDRLVCKVIRPIKKGQQIFRSYFPGQNSYKQLPILKLELQLRYHFECECMLCTNDDWSPLTDEVDFSDDPLYTIGMKPFCMTVKELRKLSRSQIQQYEKNAIDFLVKYGRFHPVNDTMGMQNTLLIMWNVLAARQ
ncbi:SET and MYND domain-containing protein 4-like [Contarinia nasturtii]|uniref:SET and MYND domain-containing protein 4-like n=1 Tax=Contarinia nasturtii TaxID=265458 RepID=UPI0012D39D99|nr:SET and MYND domain-containing protein 4-like [Contarinia nasturtii]